MEPRELIARAAFTASFPTDNPDVMYPRGPAWFHFGDKYADTILAALDKAGLMTVTKTKRKGCAKCGKPFAWNHGFRWLNGGNRVHRDCDNPTTLRR